MTPIWDAAVALLLRPWACAAILAAVMIASVAPIQNLRFDSDMNRVFMSDSALSKAQRAFEAQTGTTISDVAILVESDSLLGQSGLTAARNAALDLEFVPGVAAVSSPFALRFPPNHPDYPDAPVIPADLDGVDIAARMAAFDELGSGLGTLLTQRSLLIIAAVDTSQRPLAQTLPDILQMGAALDAQGLHTVLTGEEVINIVIAEALADDLLRLNLIGAALTVLAALVLIRDVRLTIIAVVPGILGAVATLGLAAWLGYPVTVLNNVIPVLMLVLGVANGLHLTVHLAGADGDLRSRIASTLRTVGPASVLTAATTALAFGAIMTAPNAPLIEFAILGALGVTATLVILLLGFAVLAHALAPPHRAIGIRWGRIAAAAGGAALRAPRAVVAVGIAALILAAGGFATTKAWFPLYENLPAGSDLSAANDRIAADFGGVFQAWVEMPDGTDWAALSSAVRAVQTASDNAQVLSEVAIASWLGAPDAAPTRDRLAQLPASITQRLRDPGTGTLRFAVAMPEPMRSAGALAAFDRTEQAALDAGAARVIGLPAIMRHESVTLIRQLSLGLLLAAALGAGLVAAVFRSLRLFPTVLVVNLLPVLCVGASLHVLAQGHLTPPAVLALTIAFGVAVDDTVHYLSRFRHARAAGHARDAAARAALNSAGGVMVLTTLLLTAGLAVTAFSIFLPVQLFGIMLILSLGIALLADLVLLPAMLCLGVPRDES
ncbi:efflux RND transporter permease subunit [Roseovarius arcticus]|uniref:efflux RND transporter permease subunit n=1 Tax=Roseovarius arcticus TaxID=2547404 RepID=UPI001FE9C935|nr:MMPL family transporter [Roseovarius arcticus]